MSNLRGNAQQAEFSMPRCVERSENSAQINAVGCFCVSPSMFKYFPEISSANSQELPVTKLGKIFAPSSMTRFTATSKWS